MRSSSGWQSWENSFQDYAGKDWVVCILMGALHFADLPGKFHPSDMDFMAISATAPAPRAQGKCGSCRLDAAIANRHV